MSMTPLEIALERIEECRRTRSTALDLSGLELEKIPEQVFELTWLEKLESLGCGDNQISDLSPLYGFVVNDQILHLTVPTKENADPLEDWPSPDKFWGSVQHGIRKQIEKLLQA